MHVPFCRSLCTYCAFAKQVYTGEAADRWLEGLERELHFRREHTWGRPRLDSVFVGGGTPSALTAAQWRTFGALVSRFFRLEPSVEWTSEANPESLSKHPERLEAMLAAGVNRLSLGVQSGDPEELAVLGRAHGREEVKAAVSLARKHGVERLNLDVMYGLPDQSVERFVAGLDWILSLQPDHVSAYCLGLEPGTPLAGEVARGAVPRPQDDASRDHYDTLCRRMDAAGLKQYEISNWARPGQACRHNLKYWRRESFLACGPSAHGLLGNRRWANPAPLEAWLRAYDGGPAPALKEVPLVEARFEWVFLHLRLNRGLALDDYKSRWGEPFEARYGAPLEALKREGFLEIVDGRLRLKAAGRFVSDGVFAEFASA